MLFSTPRNTPNNGDEVDHGGRKTKDFLRESALYLAKPFYREDDVTPIFDYLTIKVIFLDIGISLADTITDFYQGF